jgi:flagellar FliL protein
MKKRKRLLALLALLVLLGGAGGAYYFLFMNKRVKPPPPEETAELELTDLSVNLADKGHARYLTAAITIGVKGVAPQAALEKRRAAIEDAVIMATTQHTYTELLSPEGKGKLKDDIATAVEGALAGDRLAVEEVLFTRFLME